MGKRGPKPGETVWRDQEICALVKGAMKLGVSYEAATAAAGQHYRVSESTARKAYARFKEPTTIYIVGQLEPIVLTPQLDEMEVTRIYAALLNPPSLHPIKVAPCANAAFGSRRKKLA